MSGYLTLQSDSQIRELDMDRLDNCDFSVFPYDIYKKEVKPAMTRTIPDRYRRSHYLVKGDPSTFRHPDHYSVFGYDVGGDNHRNGINASAVHPGRYIVPNTEIDAANAALDPVGMAPPEFYIPRQSRY